MNSDNAIQVCQVKITILKKHFNKEIIEQYKSNPNEWTKCQHFEIGQEFITSLDHPWDMPQGFCGWAWADIQKLVYGMARGGGQDIFITSCTDGLRPVIFKLEKVIPNI